MQVKRVLNNNAVIVNDKGQDVLVLGLAIGFRRKEHDTIEEYEIERQYYLRDTAKNNEVEALLTRIPDEVIAFALEIVQYIHNSISQELDDNLFIMIVDHIYSSIERYRNSIQFKNLMLWEIKSFFRREFEIGVYVVERINERFDIEMLEDEAAFIALHIVNANFKVATPIATGITRFIEEMMGVVQKGIGFELDVDSLSYFRFVTHLKYLASRILTKDGFSKDGVDTELLSLLSIKYDQAFALMQDAKDWIETSYDYQLVESDCLYLTIHIQKLITSLE